jgi:hypothetical protein
MMSLGMGIGAGVIMAVLEMQGSSIFKTWAQVGKSRVWNGKILIEYACIELEHDLLFLSVPVLAALSMGLAVVMGIRFQATNKFMPAGLVCVLSVAMALVYLLRPAKSALRARPSKAE